MWEMRVPVLSTSHVKQDTISKLDSSTVAEYEEGAFVNLVILKKLLPAEMIAVQRWFAVNYPSEHWIRFDRDGDVVDCLPTYNW